MPEEGLNLALGCAMGVEHLHNSSIVHRDLAARNVLIGEDGRPLVTDFGRSRELGGDQGMTKQNLGPIKWSAPEQLEKNLYSKASDVWAFGCLCIELVDREQPWTTSVKNLEVAKYVKESPLRSFRC